MRTDRGLDRLISFLDAVVAIAITLLVLPLVEVLGEPARDTDLASALAGDAGQFGAFLLSFVVIARLWLVHHRLVERVGAYDSAFVLVNLGWILTIVVLPFATQVLAVYGRDRLAVATYIGTMAASSACLSMLGVLVWLRPSLRRAGTGTQPEPPWASLVTTGTLVVALLAGVLVPAINYFALLLLFLTGPLVGLLRLARTTAG
jgi:TMEM175 potassium channel family protein